TSGRGPSWHLNLNDCFLEGARPAQLETRQALRIGWTSSGLYMRPDVGLLQALRAPFALNLKALRALLPQNQLRLAPMADMGARRGAAPAAPWPPARARAVSSMVLLLGLV